MRRTSVYLKRTKEAVKPKEAARYAICSEQVLLRIIDREDIVHRQRGKKKKKEKKKEKKRKENFHGCFSLRRPCYSRTTVVCKFFKLD